jgi:nucleoside phosphorylase
MEAATILQVAARRGVAAACVLGVSDVAARNGSQRMSKDELAELGVRLGETGYAAVRSR